MATETTDTPPAARHATTTLIDATHALIDVGAHFHHRGWSMGASSNYSVVLEREPLTLLITASGRDKSRLGVSDFVIVAEAGKPTMAGTPKPSAETLLRTVITQRADAGAVLHTHSVWGTVLSERHFEQGELHIGGLEMLKGLAGIDAHESSARIAIFDNTQDIADLATRAERRVIDGDPALRQ